MTQIAVAAVNCNGEPIKVTGRIHLPEITIAGVKLEQEVSFWVMEKSVDEVLISNDWLRTIQGALAWKGEEQVLYFRKPRTKFSAGGHAHKSTTPEPDHTALTTITKENMSDNELEDDREDQEEEEEATEEPMATQSLTSEPEKQAKTSETPEEKENPGNDNERQGLPPSIKTIRA